jgi:chromosome segregation ATPase
MLTTIRRPIQCPQMIVDFKIINKNIKEEYERFLVLGLINEKYDYLYNQPNDKRGDFYVNINDIKKICKVCDLINSYCENYKKQYNIKTQNHSFYVIYNNIRKDYIEIIEIVYNLYKNRLQNKTNLEFANVYSQVLEKQVEDYYKILKSFDIKKLYKDYSNIKNQLEKTKVENIQKDSEISNIKTQLTDAQSYNVDLEKKIKDKDIIITEKNKQIVDFNNKVENLEKQNKNKDSEISNIKYKFECLEKEKNQEIFELKMDINKLNCEKENKFKENNNLINSLLDVKNQFKIKSEEFDDISNKNKILQNELNQVIKEKNNEIEEKVKEINNVEKELEFEKKRNDNLVIENIKNKNQITVLEVENNQKNTEINNLKKNYNDLVDKYCNLQQMLKKYWALIIQKETEDAEKNKK